MPNKKLNAFFEQSKYHMADISNKAPSFRKAIAVGRIKVGKVGFKHIKAKTLPKGDVLKLAEIAGVQGAKMTSMQIPMCHPLFLEHVAIYPQLEKKTHSVIVYSSVSTFSKTGVEMEALAAVNAALLTIYDLTKPVEPALEICDIRLLVKEGGKKGLWIHPDGALKELEFMKENAFFDYSLKGINAAVITLSDRAYHKEYEDISGNELRQAIKNLGANRVEYYLLPDEAQLLEKKINQLKNQVDLIITTGGTGLSSRDITPDVLQKLANKTVSGIGELLRKSSAEKIATSWLSRSLAVVIDKTLVIALPGSVGGVKDGVLALKPILSHALSHLKDIKNIHPNPNQED